ncbi:MAG: RNA polymerase sigma-70 factor (ECF subfamily) [Oleiphilaceae bacterium]|jgi:RNA polymerase sigma-70 factor (ECF subfamily)
MLYVCDYSKLLFKIIRSDRLLGIFVADILQTSDAKYLEKLLLKIAVDRDRNAFMALFEQCSAKLKAYAVRCGASHSDAEEVVQEALLNVWHKAHTFNPKSASANTWLFTIVRNKRIDFVRKNRPDLVVSNDLWPESEASVVLETAPNLEYEYESDLNAQVLRTLIKELPEEQRQIVYKVYFEGKSHSEIATDLDLPLGTIKSRLRLAMKKLDTLAKQNISWLIIIHLMNF